MRKIILAMAMLLPVTAGAQEFAARSSVGADYKIVKGLHIGVEEEVRSADNFEALGSIRSTAEISYKVNKYFKVGGGYTLINPYKTKLNGFGAHRDRLFLDATGSLRAGDFQFSLKERIQLTHRNDDTLNVYQNTRNALALKSKLTVKYKGFMDFEPYLFFEARTALNDPWGQISGSVQYNSDNEAYYSYAHTGYTHIYFNRWRLGLGTVWSPSKHHELSLGLLADYCSDYEIDTNGPSKWAEKGVRIYSATTGWVDTFRLSLTVGYQYKF